MIELIETNYIARATAAIFITLLIGLVVDLLLKHGVVRITRRTKTDIDDRLLRVTRIPVFLIVLLIGADLTVSIIPEIYESLTSIRDLLRSLIAITAAYMFWRISVVLFSHFIQVKVREGDVETANQMLPFLENLTKTAVLIVNIFVLLSIWGIDITPLLASAGVAGVAVAFAAKDTLANLFGGISIFIDRPYKVGDFIIVDNQERGEVYEIGLRSTRIKTRDDIFITIPNSIMATSKVVNETGLESPLRLRIAVTIGYGADLDGVEKLLLNVTYTNQEVLTEPEPRIRLRNLGENGLEYELLCWIPNPVDKGRVTHQLNRTVYQTLRSHDIVIPYPHMEISLTKK